MKKLAGKVAVVTGASKGIGAAAARALAAEGAAVVVNYSSGKEGAERVLSQIAREGGNAIAIQADVSKPAEVKRLFEQTREAFRSVDVLVNNAGVFRFEPFEAITEQEYHREFDINVFGTILVTQEALNYFPRTGGSIINISSIASENPVPQLVSLFGDQGCGGQPYDGVGQGTGAAKHPGQYRGAGAGRHRGQQGQRLRRQCSGQCGIGGDTPGREIRQTGRNCASDRLPRVGRCGVVDRRAN